MLADATLASLGSGSYSGYAPQGPISDCSGNAVVNISSDGSAVAIFGRSCVNPSMYYCSDSNDKQAGAGMPEVTEAYAKSGATLCVAGEAPAPQDTSNPFANPDMQ